MNNIVEVSPYGSLLIYKLGYTPEFVNSTIKEKNLHGLRIFSQLKKSRITNLDFLKEYAFLEALDVTIIDDCSFDFLKNLKELKSLTINVEGEHYIDLSNQSNLENLTINWRKGKIVGLDKCKKLTSLCLIDYSEKDFLPISSLTSVSTLKVKTASLTNLRGIEYLSELTSLFLGNCKKLLSLDELSYLQKITYLSFESCPQISNCNPIGKLLSLEDLQINDCKNIETVKFVNNLSALKKFSLLGNSNIVDGDLNPVKHIEKFFYKHRKHYNIKIENKGYNGLIKSNLSKINSL